jgi:hypothetical protein
MRSGHPFVRTRRYFDTNGVISVQTHATRGGETFTYHNYDPFHPAFGYFRQDKLVELQCIQNEVSIAYPCGTAFTT